MHFRKILILSLLIPLFVSCKNTKNNQALSLENNLYWALGTQFDTLEDAHNYEYQKIKAEYMNLYKKVGKNPVYLWVKIPFHLPENLQNQNLGLMIPYLYFAEKVWLNEEYIGKTGDFYPNPYSVLNNPHLYSIPESTLKSSDENFFYIKILSQGLGTISNGIILDEYSAAKRRASKISFFQTKIYMIIDGILLCAAIIFFIAYLARKSQFHILDFSVVCFLTTVALFYFFIPELPEIDYSKISFLLITKVFLYIFAFFTVFSIFSFILHFIKIEQPKSFIIFKHIILLITCIIVLAAPDFTSLMKLTIPMMITYGIHYLFAFNLVYKALPQLEKRKSAIICLIGFAPLTLNMLIDFILRFQLRNINYPYFTLIGWELSIVYFIIYLSINYAKVFHQNEKLNNNLKHEVDLRTIDLTLANERLSERQLLTEKEMDMAAIVQQKFFELPQAQYDGWEVALDYEPLEKVSGDLFEFFTTKNTLNGLALFDASGHGVSAALITMLSKNAIHQNFTKGQTEKLPISQILHQIHNSIVESKGKIDNYLTGVLLRFTENEDSTSTVELGDAGHPYPIYFSSKKQELINLKFLDSSTHYGAIAMNEITPVFSDFSFTMESGDVLVAFTDGITDIQNIQKEYYGRARLENFILKNGNLSAKELLNSLKQELSSFKKERPSTDDISIIILRKI